MRSAPIEKPEIYAIDFGTSNSLVGAASATEIFPLVPLDGHSANPEVFRSLVYFAPDKSQHFGQQAIKHYSEQSMAGRLLRSFKRFLPLKSFEGTLIDGRHWTLEDLIARFLREIRERANGHYETEVDAVLLGRPALFADSDEADNLAQERLTRAAHLAGFKRVEFLPEPVAAAYRFQQEMKHEELVLVADFGGGTSDFTLLKLSSRALIPSDVLAIGGVAIAGDAFDGALMKDAVSKNFGSQVQYTVPFGSNVLTMPKGMMSHLCSPAYIPFLNSRENREFLRQVKSWALGPSDKKVMEQLEILLDNQLGFSVFEAIEKAKRGLTSETKSHINYRYPQIEINEVLTRESFKRMSQFETQQIFDALDDTLKRGGVKANDIDRICCTGGTAKNYLIRKNLLERFPESKLAEFRNFTSIVEGLCHRAQQIIG